MEINFLAVLFRDGLLVCAVILLRAICLLLLFFIVFVTLKTYFHEDFPRFMDDWSHVIG